MKRKNRLYRDKSGHFLKGNQEGITSPDRARELQRLSVLKRAENRKSKHRLRLILEQAKIDGLDIKTQMFTILIHAALEGNIKAAKAILKALDSLCCPQCYLKMWNPRREKRYDRIEQAAKLFGIPDIPELSGRLVSKLTKMALNIDKKNVMASINAAELIFIVTGYSPCPKCRKDW